MPKFPSQIKKLLVLGADPSFYFKKERAIEWIDALKIGYLTDGHITFAFKSTMRFHTRTPSFYAIGFICFHVLRSSSQEK